MTVSFLPLSLSLSPLVTTQMQQKREREKIKKPTILLTIGVVAVCAKLIYHS